MLGQSGHRVKHYRVRGVALVALRGLDAYRENRQFARFLNCEYRRRKRARVSLRAVVLIRLDQMARGVRCEGHQSRRGCIAHAALYVQPLTR